jgi:hypothetical protein
VLQTSEDKNSSTKHSCRFTAREASLDYINTELMCFVGKKGREGYCPKKREKMEKKMGRGLFAFCYAGDGKNSFNLK